MQGARGGLKHTVGRVLVASTILAGLVVITALLTSTAKVAISAGAGAAIGMASVAALAIAVYGVVRPAGGGMRTGLFTVLSIVKFLVIGAILWWLITRSIVEPVTFMIGFSSVVVALILEWFIVGRATNRVG